MKNLLALIGVVVVVVAGAGWYLGWYKFSTDQGHVKVDLDVKKTTDDLKKFEGMVEKKIEGQSTSLPFDGKGSNFKLPELPNLPSIPQAPPLEFNPDGSLKTTIKIDLPPPPAFPNNK